MKKINGWALWFSEEDKACDSALSLLLACDKAGVGVSYLVAKSISSILESGNIRLFVDEKEVEKLPDFVVCRTGARTTYHDLAVLSVLEQLGVAVINKAEVLKLVNDKWGQFELFAKAGLPIPKTMLVSKETSLERIAHEFAFPLILKRVDGAYGQGVLLINDKLTLKDTMETLFSIDEGIKLVVQEFVQESKGISVRAFVVGGEIVDAIVKKSTIGSFKSLHNNGLDGVIEQYPISEEIKQLSQKAMDVTGLEYTAIDYLISNEGLKLCEVNGAPGLKIHGEKGADALVEYIVSRIGVSMETMNGNPL